MLLALDGTCYCNTAPPISVAPEEVEYILCFISYNQIGYKCCLKLYYKTFFIIYYKLRFKILNKDQGLTHHLVCLLTFPRFS